MSAQILSFPIPGAEFSDECAAVCGYSDAQKYDRLEREIACFMETHGCSDGDPRIADLKEKLDRIEDATRRVKHPEWHAGFRAYLQGKRRP